MSERTVDDATRYQLLKLLAEEPRLSQRELAERMGVSLGKVNYCLRAVLEKGHIKAVNFRNSRNRAAYLYKLTPAGIAAKIRVTRRFLEHKQAEYVALSIEIERLAREVSDESA